MPGRVLRVMNRERGCLDQRQRRAHVEVVGELVLPSDRARSANGPLEHGEWFDGLLLIWRVACEGEHCTTRAPVRAELFNMRPQHVRRPPLRAPTRDISCRRLGRFSLARAIVVEQFSPRQSEFLGQRIALLEVKYTQQHENQNDGQRDAK